MKTAPPAGRRFTDLKDSGRAVPYRTWSQRPHAYWTFPSVAGCTSTWLEALAELWAHSGRLWGSARRLETVAVGLVPAVACLSKDLVDEQTLGQSIKLRIGSARVERLSSAPGETPSNA